MNKVFTILIFFLLPFFVSLAQSTVSMSVSPTLFEMTASPSQSWKSSVRVINSNNFDMTVYANAVNFAPKGEGGDGLFLPVFENETQGMTLAEWIDITNEPIIIPRQQTVEIPFTVNVPEDANPGGHFAAILVGTRPPVDERNVPKVQTSQMVSSLFFVRIAGDVVESGTIREFRTTSSFLTKPEATLELRFENKGNVHIQPQGDVRIYNMWGQERGVIPINKQSHFGNVLPQSIRKFTFSWKGEWALSDIGRYSAEVTLAYGSDGRKFVSSETNFWVVPIKEMVFILIGLGIFVTLVVWFVRLYVRKMLMVAGINPEDKSRKVLNNSIEIASKKKVSLTAPLKVGILDLKSKLSNTSEEESKFTTVLQIIRGYWKFIIAVIAIIVFVIIFYKYVSSATTDERSFEVTYVNNDSDITLTSEEIAYNELKEDNPVESIVNEGLPKITIVNRSGLPGLAAETKLRLEKFGYEVISMKTESDDPQKKTVIVYNESDQEKALNLSKELENALVSVDNTSNITNEITIFLGSDINKD